MRKAVILFNLGGPDKLESVEPFLFNLFNDPAIISIPSIFRYPLAKFISKKRAPVAKNIYREIENKSPILELTQKQANSLENNLSKKGDYKCFVVMRCWHPRASQVINQVKGYDPCKADVWSFGCTLLEIATRKRPWYHVDCDTIHSSIN